MCIRDSIQSWRWCRLTEEDKHARWTRVEPGQTWLRSVGLREFQVKKIPELFGDEPYFKVWARPASGRKDCGKWNPVGEESTLLKAQLVAEAYYETN